MTLNKTILFVGDVHLNFSSPASRIDDYPETCLEKLNQVLDIAIKYDSGHIVFLGDLWHKNAQSNAYMNKVCSVFRKIKDAGIQAHVIYGNHELVYDSMDYADRSPLGILISSGLVNHLSKLEIVFPNTNVVLHGYDYPDPIEQVAPDYKYHICVAHRFYNYDFDKATLRKENISHLGYSAYVLGHDHTQYAPETVGVSTIIRPGSLTRGTAHSYNLSKIVSVALFSPADDANPWSYIALDIKPAEEVFTSKVTQEDSEETLIAEMDEIIERMRSTRKTSVYSYLDSIDVPEKVKTVIENYLISVGILRTKEGVPQ